ncbi:hypothetical protein KEM60_01311 [Austwickia sp. TVS 96-490-7B]|uniref:hypothetical protein n=1 Tax=Austwickia sp. TVS 96-490-7B TaxID=2830843 RepID=UPI001C566A5D|nr:hypothetical protein [Austwickia sp. TVS 96-490-7B]MBW3085117.1 hypothetical protein [Austwickia sp. TVS 96-490-7B]
MMRPRSYRRVLIAATALSVMSSPLVMIDGAQAVDAPGARPTGAGGAVPPPQTGDLLYRVTPLISLPGMDRAAVTTGVDVTDASMLLVRIGPALPGHGDDGSGGFLTGPGTIGARLNLLKTCPGGEPENWRPVAANARGNVMGVGECRSWEDSQVSQLSVVWSSLDDFSETVDECPAGSGCRVDAVALNARGAALTTKEMTVAHSLVTNVTGGGQSRELVAEQDGMQVRGTALADDGTVVGVMQVRVGGTTVWQPFVAPGRAQTPVPLPLPAGIPASAVGSEVRLLTSPDGKMIIARIGDSVVSWDAARTATISAAGSGFVPVDIAADHVVVGRTPQGPALWRGGIVRSVQVRRLPGDARLVDAGAINKHHQIAATMGYPDGRRKAVLISPVPPTER